MVMNRLQHGSWRVHSLRSATQSHALLDRVLQGAARDVLKDDHNSLVYSVAHGGERLIVKYPTARNRRWQERVTSLWRKGKALRAWQGMVVLREMDIAVPEPILVGEQRRCGVIVDSFVVYVFAEGEPVTAADAPAIDRLLARLHERGYLRHDASMHNYLRQRGQVMMIDTTLHRPIFFRRSRCLLEHLTFRCDAPDVWYAFYGDIVPRWQLQLLAWFWRCRAGYHARRRGWKAWLRGRGEALPATGGYGNDD